MDADEETLVTDIELAPDGQVRIFGASLEILQLLGDLDLGDERLASRLAVMKKASASLSKPDALCSEHQQSRPEDEEQA